MAFIIPWIGAGIAIGSALFGHESQRKQASMMEDSARAQERQQRKLTQFELARHTEESEAFSAQQKAAFAASGLSLDPDQSPFTVMSETQRRFIAERQRIASGGAAAAGARGTEASMYATRRRNIQIGGSLETLGTITGELGQFFTSSSKGSSGGTSGGFSI